MGRSKQYDRTELLDRAVELFRRQGFNGTSTTELVNELGVNRKSMYAEFGSKQELFEAALEHYDRNHLTRVLAPIEAADAGVDAIRQAFAGYASANEGWFRGRGCLMCNTAVERGALDPASGRFATAYLDRINRAFRHALGNGRQAGDLDETTDLDEMAAFLTTLLIGVAASVRAEAPPEQLHATSRAVSSILEKAPVDNRAMRALAHRNRPAKPSLQKPSQIPSTRSSSEVAPHSDQQFWKQNAHIDE